MMKNNQKAYNSISVVKEYKAKTTLFNGENALVERFKTKSNNGKMLDIGVGTGRTTEFFSEFFDQYIGIDYAEEMISSAKGKYECNDNISFFHMDATNMNLFKDNEFDFILFSFNGLDFVSFEDRNIILKEIKRIGKPNALFSYTTHNIFNIQKLFSFHIPRNPFNIFSEFIRYRKINKLNKKTEHLIKNDYVYVIDGSIDFSVQFYYCNPKFEIQLLESLDFSPFEFSSLKTGDKYKVDTKWEEINTPWIMINSYINE